MSHLNVLAVLEALGVKLSVDWDGELTIEVPAKLPGAALRGFLCEHATRLREQVEGRAILDRWRFIGGPLAGRRHGLGGALWGKKYKGFRQKRGHWAVYEFSRDGRAFFRGYATSEAKARCGQVANARESNAS